MYNNYSIYIYLLIFILLFIIIYYIYNKNIEHFNVQAIDYKHDIRCAKDKIYYDFCLSEFGICPNYYPDDPSKDYTGKRINGKNCPLICKIVVGIALFSRSAAVNLLKDHNSINNYNKNISEIQKYMEKINDKNLDIKNGLIDDFFIETKDNLSPVLWINLGSQKPNDKYIKDLEDLDLDALLILKETLKEKTLNNFDKSIIEIDILKLYENIENSNLLQSVKTRIINNGNYNELKRTDDFFTNLFNNYINNHKKIPIFKIKYDDNTNRYFAPIMVDICNLVQKVEEYTTSRINEGYHKQETLSNGRNKYITNNELKTTCSNLNFNKKGDSSDKYTKYANNEEILDVSQSDSSTDKENLINKFKDLFENNRTIITDRYSLPEESVIEKEIKDILEDRNEINSKRYITNEELEYILSELQTWKTNKLADLNPNSLCEYKYNALQDAIYDSEKLLFNGKEFGKIALRINDNGDIIDEKDNEIYQDQKLYVLNADVNDKKQLVEKEIDECLVRKSNTYIQDKWIENPNLTINDDGTEWSKRCDDNTTCMPDDYVEVNKYLTKKEELDRNINNCKIKKNERWGLQKEINIADGENIELGRIGDSIQHYNRYSKHIEDINNIKENENNCQYFESELIGNKVNIKNIKDNIDEWYGKIGTNDNNYMTTSDFDNKLNTDCAIFNSEWNENNNRSTTGYGLIGNETGKYGIVTKLDFKTRDPNKYITNSQCIEDINRERQLHQDNYTQSPTDSLINERKTQIQELINNNKNLTYNNLTNIQKLNNLYGECIQQHTPDGETNEPVISYSEFNEKVENNKNNELDWWYQNAINSANFDVDNEYKGKKYSGGEKQDQTCPPTDEDWLAPNTCKEDDYECRSIDNTISISNYNNTIESEKEILNYLTDAPCSENTGKSTMGAIERKGFDDNIDKYANKYSANGQICNKEGNKPSNFKEPGTDSVCVYGQYCTTNLDIHNEYINKYNMEKEKETCNQLNRNICSAYELPIQSNNITDLPIQVINPIENTLPPLFTYGRINDITKPPNYSEI